MTRPDISFVVSVGQFLNSPCGSQWDAVMQIGMDVLVINVQHLVIVFLLEGILFLGKAKKQSVVARSRAETEYRAMALTQYELIWLNSND
ncbi:hypothetical protein A2U01_0019866 [Trifolium medium]|uniref:Uncharacterized protein n=1 Tax=Trifolium medium TaxID=97028 RepID=A0A392NG65_9FABA|nr:hypothetical protein [Trifolium medium]